MGSYFTYIQAKKLNIDNSPKKQNAVASLNCNFFLIYTSLYHGISEQLNKSAWPLRFSPPNKSVPTLLLTQCLVFLRNYCMTQQYFFPSKHHKNLPLYHIHLYLPDFVSVKKVISQLWYEITIILTTTAAAPPPL